MSSQGMMTLFALYRFMLKGSQMPFSIAVNLSPILGGSENSDELIEIDESGAPVEGVDDSHYKPKVAKKAPKKKLAKRLNR